MKWVVMLLGVGIVAYTFYPASREPMPVVNVQPSESASTSPDPSVAVEKVTPTVVPVNPTARSSPYQPTPADVLPEVEALAQKANEYSLLPEGDRNWVLNTAAHSYLAGQVAYADLVQHIEELSSIRRFAVLERTETYTPDLEADRDDHPEVEQ